MGVQRRSAGFIGTDSNTWVTSPSPVYYGVWQPNSIVNYSEVSQWASPGSLPAQEPISAFLYGPAEPAGSGPGSITIPANTPHVYVFIGAGGGGGGVDHDNGQARPGGSGGQRYALFARPAVANSGQTTMNYNVGNGGAGAPNRSNDGNGGGGNGSSVTFGNFNMSTNGGGGGCGKCQSNGSTGNSSQNGTIVFGGSGGGAPSYMTGSNEPDNFVPVVNIPVSSEGVNFSNGAGGSNGGSQPAPGGPGGIYVRFGRGINASTAPGSGNDYGISNPTYGVPDAAKLLDI